MSMKVFALFVGVCVAEESALVFEVSAEQAQKRKTATATGSIVSSPHASSNPP
jgi:hypothetical protein